MAALRHLPCCLVGIYSHVDEGPIAYRRTLDGRVFRADEMEDVFVDGISNLESDAREKITLTGWLFDMILHGVFEPLDEYVD